jgi:hypothetical protein
VTIACCISRLGQGKGSPIVFGFLVDKPNGCIPFHPPKRRQVANVPEKSVKEKSVKEHDNVNNNPIYRIATYNKELQVSNLRQKHAISIKSQY